MNDIGSAKDWIVFGSSVIVWAFALGVVWAKLNDRMERIEKESKKDTDGLGSRVKEVELAASSRDGRIGTMELSLAEYRRDTQEAVKGLSRVEKGVDDLHEDINQGNILLGTQLHNIEKMIQDKDLRTQTRLVRIETVVQIENKIGPLPLDA